MQSNPLDSPAMHRCLLYTNAKPNLNNELNAKTFVSPANPN